MKLLRNFGLFLMLFISAIPALCLAEPASVTDPAAVKALMLRKGVAPDSVAKLVELIVENKRDLAAGKVSAALTIEVEDIPPIRDRKGLAAVIPGAENMPEIAPLPELTRENFLEMIEKLFNTDDVGSWLHNDEGKIPTDEEMKKYVSWRKSDESGMKGAMDKLDNKFGKEAVTEWFDLFNKGAATAPVRTRELYRILLDYSRLIIVFKHINSPNKYQYRGAKETGAFLLLSGSSSSGVIAVQLQKERLKYLLAPGDAMAKAGFAAIDGAQAFIKHYRAMVVSENSDERSKKLDEEIRQADERGRQADERGRQAHEEAQQAREGIDIVRSINKILDRLDVNLPQFLDSSNSVEKKRLKQALFEDWKALDALSGRANKINETDLVQKIGMLKKRLERAGVTE